MDSEVGTRLADLVRQVATLEQRQQEVLERLKTVEEVAVTVKRWVFRGVAIVVGATATLNGGEIGEILGRILQPPAA